MDVISRHPFFGRLLTYLFIVLLILGGYLYGKERGATINTRAVQACHTSLNLLDQSLDCEKVEDAKLKVTTLETEINDEINRARDEHHISRAAVFYRDLTTRRWFGVNADAEFYPASLAKLPLAMVYFKAADIEPTIFDQELPLTIAPGFSNNGQRVMSDSPLEIGKKYTTRSLVEDMLIYSDNRPIGPLSQFMHQDIWHKVYSDLGIRKQMDTGEEVWSVTPRITALIFRSLYNASYLDPEASQDLLKLMTQARYVKGLVAGVDQSVLVAHKFGEATMVNDDGTTTPVLHDCGIIYKPEKPYILCVMTEGRDFEELERIIAKISSIVYKEQ